MATIDYPPSLPDFRLGKQREQVQTYRTSQPFNGPLFIEKITDESPVVWDVTIMCKSQGQARGFQAFLRQIKNGTPFNKDILIEEGFSTHEVRFIEEPLAPRQLSPHVWVYTGVIYATKLIQPDALVDDNLIILYAGQAGIIDTAVNIFWPEFIPVVNPFARLANPLVHLFTNDKTVEKLTNGTLTTDRATTGTFIDRNDGLLKTAAIDNIREEAEGFLIEGASTNLLLRSEEFDNAAWSSALVAVTADTDTAPDGVVSADNTARTTTGNSNFVSQVITKSASANTYTFSIYINRTLGGSWFSVRLQGLFPARVDLIYDKANDILGTPATQGAFTGASAKTEIVGAYVRLSLTVTSDSHTALNCIFAPRSTSGFVDDTDPSSSAFAVVWGAQLEQLPFASSYIPTTTTAVTRAADDISILATGNIPGPTADYSVLAKVGVLGLTGTNQSFWQVEGETFREGLIVSTGNGITKTFHGGAFESISSADYDESTQTNIATTVASNVINLYVSASLTASSPSATTTSITGTKTVINIGNELGSGHLFGHVSDFMIYDFEATSTEIALLQG